MKKAYPYNELSDRRYPCGKRLKKRLVEARLLHNITKCFRCYMAVLRAWRNRPIDRADRRLWMYLKYGQ